MDNTFVPIDSNEKNLKLDQDDRETFNKYGVKDPKLYVPSTEKKSKKNLESPSGIISFLGLAKIFVQI